MSSWTTDERKNVFIITLLVAGLAIASWGWFSAEEQLQAARNAGNLQGGLDELAVCDNLETSRDIDACDEALRNVRGTLLDYQERLTDIQERRNAAGDDEVDTSTEVEAEVEAQ